MSLDLTDCQFHGPALPEPFVKFELEKELSKLKLIPKVTGDEGRQLRELWNSYRRNLSALAGGGPLRVRNQVLDPILQILGYARTESAPDVQTREDLEPGGAFLISEDASKRLRAWTTQFNEDLYAPAKRGRAYRFSHLRIAQRVLLATGERVGLLTNGVQLLILISDPARPDSTVSIPIDGGWKRSRDIPDSFKFLLAISSPRGVEAVPDLVDKARLKQTRVTKELRVQARQAIQYFVQEVMDHPANTEWFALHTDREPLAKSLWREGLSIVYRLLFVLKLESSDDPARSFTFASTSLWRNTFSPSITLARYASEVLETGTETGSLLEDGLRVLFRMFEEGVECTELVVKPLGGALFGSNATPTLSNLKWGERAVAMLFDQLLCTPKRRGSHSRERVHYGPLDVEDLGRVYEALLELEPGITSQPMCRLRRQKLEVVVPIAQGQKYRTPESVGQGNLGDDVEDIEADDSESDEDDTIASGKKTKVQWIEEIPPHRFYLRVGLGRKASGSYYTPHSFVRFLVQETLGPQVAERSPQDDPKPLEILKLKVLDPAMGSGHFLVEACRFLGEKLYEACRLCDEKASEAERKAERLKDAAKNEALRQAQQWRQRILDLPDPTAELPKYLPSRSPEGEESGYSQKKAEALCRRLVATHCLYGVDKNPLAVELAKLSLWLEAHGEGMPLTFLDHRLVVGDSLNGPFWDKLFFCPGRPRQPIENLFHRGIEISFTRALGRAIRNVSELEANVGISLSEIEDKKRLKAEMDLALLPFRVAAAAWSGGVMLGPEQCDDRAYADMLQAIAQTGDLPERIESERLRNAIVRGFGLDEVPPERELLYTLLGSNAFVSALPYDLNFPEVFYANGVPQRRMGFHAVLGNPPWEGIDSSNKEFFGAFDFAILEIQDEDETNDLIGSLMRIEEVRRGREKYEMDIAAQKYSARVLLEFANLGRESASGATPDMYQCFAERKTQFLRDGGRVGVILPSGFHANEGATGLRRLYLKSMKLQSCYSYENRKQLFEIHRSFKFALVIAQKGAVTDSFLAAFYLHDEAWVFSDSRLPKPLQYSMDFVKATTGEALNLLELRDSRDVSPAKTAYQSRSAFFGEYRRSQGILPTEELHLSKNRWRLLHINHIIRQQNNDPREPLIRRALLSEGHLLFYEGKHVSHYSDNWGDPPRYCVPLERLRGKERRVQAARHYRLAFRTVARSTDERSAVFVVLVPGVVCSNSLAPESQPQERANNNALILIAMANAFSFDWLLRLTVAANITFNFLDYVPIPTVAERARLMSHSALRLTCNHVGYEPLWREQVRDAWREPNKDPLTWPVIADDDERWEVRAAIDAVVADGYRFSRDQYEHILSTFSHTSYPKARQLCLAKFDELKAIGLEAFTKKYDPYWDIPLNENLPQPVIDLPIPEEPIDGQTVSLFGEQATRKSKRSRRKT